jgi:hypothetical protein
LPTSSVTLNGSASSDADGSLTTYAWSKISGPASYNIVTSWAASPAVNGLAQGTYAFRLVVTDNNGATDDDTVLVNVNAALPPPNAPPVANAGVDQSVTLPANSVTLIGTGSGILMDRSHHMPGQKSPTISNTIANPTAGSTAVNNLVQGTYSFRLLVTDNNGATDDDTVNVTVYPVPPPANIPPVANAGADQGITLPTNSITLNGTASSDPDGTIASYLRN